MEPWSVVKHRLMRSVYRGYPVGEPTHLGDAPPTSARPRAAAALADRIGDKSA